MTIDGVTTQLTVLCVVTKRPLSRLCRNHNTVYDLMVDYLQITTRHYLVQCYPQKLKLIAIYWSVRLIGCRVPDLVQMDLHKFVLYCTKQYITINTHSKLTGHQHTYTLVLSRTINSSYNSLIEFDRSSHNVGSTHLSIGWSKWYVVKISRINGASIDWIMWNKVSRPYIWLHHNKFLSHPYITH